MIQRLHIRSNRGFTLIEVMVALFLLGIIVAAVYSSWIAVVRGSKVGLSAAAEVQRSRVAMRTMEDALTSVRMFVADSEYYSFEAENGNKAYLSFVANLPESFPRSGKFGDMMVRRVTFAIEEGSDGESQLVLRQTPLLMDLDVDEQNHPVVLAKNVTKFELGFWDLRNAEWLDEWTQTNQLPPMVKVTMQFGQKGYQSQPRDEVARVVAIPAVAVPSVWQTPNQPGRPPINPGLPRP
ncbi:MAG: prepilin-type N-terminal cleavage/methylation domain-containing protein [Verrucomicrobiota bacterium]